MVSHAGSVLLLDTIRASGVDRALSAALEPWRRPTAIHDPAKRRRIADLEPRADADTPAGARAVEVLRHVIVSGNAAATLV